MSVTNGPRRGLMINALTGDSFDSDFRKFLRAIDALLQARVISLTLSAPPGSPANGDAYIVNPTGSGAWAAHDNAIAIWTTDNPAGATWEFYPATTGMLVYNIADSTVYFWNGSAWTSIAASGGAVTGAANLGTGAGTISAGVSGSTLQLKTIKAGANVTITNNTNDITIASSGGGGGGSGTLAGDSDVDIVSPTGGEVLTYDAGSSLWKNQAPTGGSAVLNPSKRSTDEGTITRALGTVYQNTGSDPIVVSIFSAGNDLTAYSDSSASPTTKVWDESNFIGAFNPGIFVVMPGDFYKVTSTSSTEYHWIEYVFNIATAWTSSTPARALGTNYHNTSGAAILVSVVLGSGSSGDAITAYCDATSTPSAVVFTGYTKAATLSAFLIVPDGYYYRVATSGSAAVVTWREIATGLTATYSSNLAAFTVSASTYLRRMGKPSLNRSTNPKFVVTRCLDGSNTGTYTLYADDNISPVHRVCGASVWSGFAAAVFGLALAREMFEFFFDTNPTEDIHAGWWYEVELSQ